MRLGSLIQTPAQPLEAPPDHLPVAVLRQEAGARQPDLQMPLSTLQLAQPPARVADVQMQGRKEALQGGVNRLPILFATRPRGSLERQKIPFELRRGLLLAISEEMSDGASLKRRVALDHSDQSRSSSVRAATRSPDWNIPTADMISSMPGLVVSMRR